MSPQEFILDLYKILLEQKWSMHDIDNMDIMYYIKVLAWTHNSKKENNEDVYIDQCSWL